MTTAAPRPAAAVAMPMGFPCAAACRALLLPAARWCSSSADWTLREAPPDLLDPERCILFAALARPPDIEARSPAAVPGRTRESEERRRSSDAARTPELASLERALARKGLRLGSPEAAAHPAGASASACTGSPTPGPPGPDFLLPSPRRLRGLVPAGWPPAPRPAGCRTRFSSAASALPLLFSCPRTPSRLATA